MRYKPYPKYKESGVAWLGEVPEGWKQTYLKYISNVNMGQSPSSKSYNTDGNGIEFLQGNADFKKLNPIARTFTTEIKKISSIEDILFTVRAPVGAMNISDKKYAIGRGLCAISANKKSKKEFLWWLMRVLTVELKTVATGSTYEAVSVEQVNNLRVELPSLKEQKAIANYLDQKTQKIDTLIEKQQTLIKLLKEKRQALISHAVTKGLDDTVKMKDSGVAWLGEVPEHWDVSKIKFYTNIKGRIGFRGYKKEDLVLKSEGALVLGASEMNNNAKIILNNPQYISWIKYYESPEIILKKDDILFVQRGSTVGKVAHIDYDIEEATINPSLVVLKKIKLDVSFLKYFLMSDIIKAIVKVQTSSTAIPMISQEQIGNYIIVKPPLKEQKKIAQYLDQKTKQIDTLISKSTQAIELLKERRSALISAVVTGKVDVRGEVC